MLEIINLNILPVFFLVFVRILSFFVILPLFSYRTIPLIFKIGLSFFLALILTVSLDMAVIQFDLLYILYVFKEITIGIFIGLIAYIILSAVQIAGGFIDFQMGFAIANVIDPQTGAQSPLIGQYFYIIALLFLLTVNGHHLLIDGIYNSFQVIPLEQWLVFDGNFSQYILTSFSQMFIIAFQMALPLVGCLFLVDVALGIIARTVPQLNVFVVGLPLKITVSFIVLSFFMSLYIILARTIFETMFKAMQDLMVIIGG